MVELGVANKEGSGNWPRIAVDPAFARFFSQVPLKLQSILKSRFDRFKKSEEVKDSGLLRSRKEQKSSNFKVDLDKQLQLWRENPLWDVEMPRIDVRVPKGSLCNLCVSVDLGLPPDAVYNIVTDPDNRRVFKNIKEVVSRKVLLDDGSRQVVDLEQAAIWKFLWWSGTISVHVVVDQNREDYSMKFKQAKSGFMKKFEGSWRVEPVFVDEELCSSKPRTLSEYNSCTRGKGRIGSRISLDQLLQPAIVPPPPLSWYLRGITTKTTEMLINDLAAEAARIKGVSEVDSYPEDQQFRETSDGTKELDNVSDIKERWAIRRRNARRYRLKL